MSDFPKGFPGTEHYRERIELFEKVLEKKKPNDLAADAQIMVSGMRALCDHIEWQQDHIEALDMALRASGERREVAEKKVEELEDYINRAIKQLYDGLDMFDHDMRFHAENAVEVLGKAATKEGSTCTESSEEKP